MDNSLVQEVEEVQEVSKVEEEAEAGKLGSSRQGGRGKEDIESELVMSWGREGEQFQA